MRNVAFARIKEEYSETYMSELERIKKAKKVFVYRVASVRKGAIDAPVKLGAYMVHDTKKWATKPIDIFDLSSGDAVFQWGIDLKLIEEFNSLKDADAFLARVRSEKED